MKRSILPAAPRGLDATLPTVAGAEIDAIELAEDGGLHLCMSDGSRGYVPKQQDAKQGAATAEAVIATLGDSVPSRLAVGVTLVRQEFRIDGRRRVMFAQMESRVQ